MKVLVMAGSKHGATLGVAQAIGEELAAHGLDTRVVDTERAPDDVAAYDAFVIGSAVYIGHWVKDAKRVIEANHDAIEGHPVWLFSVGPLGDPPASSEEPVDVAELVASTNARGHHLFTGALDKADLSLVERATVRAVHAPYGDFRDWDQVKAWAAEIAADLTA